MIIHGNKQISERLYARKASEGGGAVRLTNIIRGAQVVLGGLDPKVAWLTKATRAAILAAFGQTDGYAVIKATNAYLNALAATDQTKASALAGFINEDPMFVCSLGLQPQGVEMPSRYVYGDGQAWFNTNYPLYSVANWDIIYDMELIGLFNYQGILSFYSFNNSYESWVYSDGRFSFRWNGLRYDTVLSAYTRYKIHLNRTGNDFKIYVDDVLKQSFTNSGTPTGTSKEYNLCFPRNSIGKQKHYHVRFTNGDDIVRELIPFKTGKAWAAEDVSTGVVQAVGTCGMIDLVSGTFYPNANTSGSFSIAYTLPDGTPWTPLNQTP